MDDVLLEHRSALEKGTAFVMCSAKTKELGKLEMITTEVILTRIPFLGRILISSDVNELKTDRIQQVSVPHSGSVCCLKLIESELAYS